MSKPFALYRLDDKRRLVRYFVSRQLEPTRIINALEDLEPSVSWKGWFLEHRADVYSSEQHPLAARAARDREQFDRWE